MKGGRRITTWVIPFGKRSLPFERNKSVDGGFDRLEIFGGAVSGDTGLRSKSFFGETQSWGICSGRNDVPVHIACEGVGEVLVEN